MQHDELPLDKFRQRAEWRRDRCLSAGSALVVIAAALTAMSVLAASAGPTIDGSARSIYKRSNPTLVTSAAQTSLAEIPKAFRGLWSESGNDSFVCRASEHDVGLVTDDERIISIRDKSIALSESGCRITAVSTKMRPARTTQNSISVSLSCEGEGTSWTRREIWTLRRDGGADRLAITDLSGRSVNTYKKCETDKTSGQPSRNTSEPTSQSEPTLKAPGASSPGSNKAESRQRESAQEASDVDRAQESAGNGEVAACNAPEVLSVMTGNVDKVKAEFRKAFANARPGSEASAYTPIIEKWEAKIQNIRQISFDQTNNTRVCAADFKYNLQLPLAMYLIASGMPGGDALCRGPVIYRVESTLDSPNGVYVTYRCQ